MFESDQKQSLDQLDADSSSIPLPSLWLWTVVGLFLLLLLGSVGGIMMFRYVLRTDQQQRVIDILPFAEVLLPRRTIVGAALTPAAEQSDPISTNDRVNPLPDELTPEADSPLVYLEPDHTANAATSAPVLITPAFEPTASIEQAVSIHPTETPASPAATLVNRPGYHLLDGFTWILQTWNNCGPASVTIALSYFGWTHGQEVARAVLRPDSEDKNVTRSEMVAFVNQETEVRAVTRMGGNIELLRLLIANGFPVIVSVGFMPSGEDWLGHYQTIVGYDDSQQVFYVYDSILGSGANGEGLTISYVDFDRSWQNFNRDFIVLFQPQNESLVAGLLGGLADPVTAAEQAFLSAQLEARTDPQNEFAWFNMGTALVALQRYEEAATFYDQARRLGLPWRMLWYQFGPYEAYYNIGRYDDVLALTASSLNNGGQYVEETYYWRGMALAAQGQTQEASQAFQQALVHNPLYQAAQTALDSLDS